MGLRHQRGKLCEPARKQISESKMTKGYCHQCEHWTKAGVIYMDNPRHYGLKEICFIEVGHCVVTALVSDGEHPQKITNVRGLTAEDFTCDAFKPRDLSNETDADAKDAS